MPDVQVTESSLAVLSSGGLDSAILLGEAVRDYQSVHPLYIRCGLFYEPVEMKYLREYLRALRGPALQPLQVLSMPVTDLYGDHWSITGREVPSHKTPDEAVFMPGRNVLLLSKAMLWCHLHHVPAVALASLRTNPFPDATPGFFAGIESIVNRAVAGAVHIRLPYSQLNKTDVMLRGRAFPLEHTFSCIDPKRGKHCGGCNKCHERRQAFTTAGMSDPTVYVGKREIEKRRKREKERQKSRG